MGPACGVWLLKWNPAAPFVVSAAFSVVLLAAFWILRLGNGKLIVRAGNPAPNPLAYLSRFFRQPRLVAGWSFAVLRSCGWWVYIVYLPIFAVENGLGDELGGTALSISNGVLFVTPLMLRWMRRRTIRHSVRLGFFASGTLFTLAGLAGGMPWLTVALLMAGAFYLILLDVCAGLPFLMAVKPSERTEMSAIYASYRDVSGIATPGFAWVVLTFAPVAAVFCASGVGLLAAWSLSGRLHPRLGTVRAPRSALAPAATV